VKLGRATVCLPIKDRLVSHAFYTDLGSSPWELGVDGPPEPLQFEISVGLRVMLIPRLRRPRRPYVAGQPRLRLPDSIGAHQVHPLGLAAPNP
jgi:hypothetical protein